MVARVSCEEPCEDFQDLHRTLSTMEGHMLWYIKVRLFSSDVPHLLRRSITHLKPDSEKMESTIR